MRVLFAAITLGFLTVFAQASPYNPDCKVVYALSGPVCVSSPIEQPKYFGTRTKSAKPAKQQKKVAGRVFTPSPVVSWRSDATAWINEARRYKGMTGAQLGVKHRRLWCGEFMGKVARATGIPTPRNPNWAADWSEVGTRISGPQPGAVALIARRGRIAHVGIVTGVDANGNPIIISGNHNDRVVETAYPRGSVVAYVMPGA